MTSGFNQFLSCLLGIALVNILLSVGFYLMFLFGNNFNIAKE